MFEHPGNLYPEVVLFGNCTFSKSARLRMMLKVWFGLELVLTLYLAASGQSVLLSGRKRYIT